MNSPLRKKAKVKSEANGETTFVFHDVPPLLEDERTVLAALLFGSALLSYETTKTEPFFRSTATHGNQWSCVVLLGALPTAPTNVHDAPPSTNLERKTSVLVVLPAGHEKLGLDVTKVGNENELPALLSDQTT